MGNDASRPPASGQAPYPGQNRPRPNSQSPAPQQAQQPLRLPQRNRVPNTQPGAFMIAGTGAVGQIRAQVRIPPGVRPGQHFPVMLEGQQVMVRCPERANQGDLIQIEFQASTFIVTVPDGVREGEAFDVMVRGARQRVTCPQGVRPGMQIRFSLPPSGPGGGGAPPPMPEPTPFEKLYEVVVPQGVRPGEPFVLLADGQRVTVTCPPDARTGQKIRFKLPIAPTDEQVQAFQLKYNKDGWIRSLGVDLKFHWARHESRRGGLGQGLMNDKGGGGTRSSSSKFCVDQTAFVRQLAPSPDGQGMALTLVAPHALSIETTVPKTSINFQTLIKGSTMPFEQKVELFRKHLTSLRVPWETGHMEIRVRRSNLLTDSMVAFEAVPKDNLKMIFRFEFLGEPGIDAGGVAREWYDQVSNALFNPNFGLFAYSGVDQMCMQVNPASGFVEPHHLRYFRFVGRMMGKALFDGQIVAHHLVRPLYKHILAWPVVLQDLEYLDSETFTNLAKLQEMTGLEDLCLDFSVNENFLGDSRIVDLVPDGRNITLTDDKLDEYLEANLRYRLLDRFNGQLREMLIGFYEVIPEALLSIFDFQELELLLCGMPNIDIDDWIRNTEYGGEFARTGQSHKVVQWFWEVVREDFNEEQRARLLQFSTGTSGVPAQGFVYLQGNDGNVRRFTINSCPLEQSLYPRAHTCFNRIDLPLYKSKKDLKQNLSLAIQMEATGFDIE